MSYNVITYFQISEDAESIRRNIIVSNFRMCISAVIDYIMMKMLENFRKNCY